MTISSIDIKNIIEERRYCEFAIGTGEEYAFDGLAGILLIVTYGNGSSMAY